MTMVIAYEVNYCLSALYIALVSS